MLSSTWQLDKKKKKEKGESAERDGNQSENVSTRDVSQRDGARVTFTLKRCGW